MDAYSIEAHGLVVQPLPRRLHLAASVDGDGCHRCRTRDQWLLSGCQLSVTHPRRKGGYINIADLREGGGAGTAALPLFPGGRAGGRLPQRTPLGRREASPAVLSALVGRARREVSCRCAAVGRGCRKTFRRGQNVSVMVGVAVVAAAVAAVEEVVAGVLGGRAGGSVTGKGGREGKKARRARIFQAQVAKAVQWKEARGFLLFSTTLGTHRYLAASQ